MNESWPASEPIATEGATDRVLGSVQAGERSWPVVRAGHEHLGAIVALLADDVLGRDREAAEDAPYEAAFTAIDADTNQVLLVVLDDAEPGDSPRNVVATAQLTFIPGLSRGGALRAQIEAVRVGAGNRGLGLGETFFTWMIDFSARRGADLIQLTTDRQRTDALRFYERLGFVASHHGMKLALPRQGTPD